MLYSLRSSTEGYSLLQPWLEALPHPYSPLVVTLLFRGPREPQGDSAQIAASLGAIRVFSSLFLCTVLHQIDRDSFYSPEVQKDLYGPHGIVIKYT